ncbi:hypothetical protein H8N00_34275 [Streptomyces sp. AC563]|uniref:hypothetical protein n=1 Tax=Streptomyces buecherae TaxID=2763006 RepID=UPI00164DC6A5|nr:hypothetical protein [Streptomyces buecherae]MBC3993854.1 hypothetical protein [Streptomyces buecherae]
MSTRTLRTSVVALLTAGFAAGTLGTTPAEAAGLRGGRVTWYAAGERVRVTDTRADGYAFGVRLYDTRRPKAVRTCAVNGRGRSRVCDFAFPEGRRIIIVARLKKGSRALYAGSVQVRS